MLNAAKWGRVDFVHFLLCNSVVRVNDTDERGNTALMWAVRNKYTRIISLLLQTDTVDVKQ